MVSAWLLLTPQGLDDYIVLQDVAIIWFARHCAHIAKGSAPCLDRTGEPDHEVCLHSGTGPLGRGVSATADGTPAALVQTHCVGPAACCVQSLASIPVPPLPPHPSSLLTDHPPGFVIPVLPAVQAGFWASFARPYHLIERATCTYENLTRTTPVGSFLKKTIKGTGVGRNPDFPVAADCQVGFRNHRYQRCLSR